MARVELPQWMDDDSITIRVPTRDHPAGKDYTFAAPDIDTGTRLAAIAELGIRAAAGRDLTEADVAAIDLDDADERNLYRDVMGATYDQLVDDGVSWTRLQRLGRYLFILHGLGEDAAAQAVQRSTSGGVQPPANRGQRRAAKKNTPKKKSTRKASPAGSTHPSSSAQA